MKLLLLFLTIPLIELALLILIGTKIGVMQTILLIIGTAIVGVQVAKSQGLRILMQMQNKLKEGVMPHDSLIEGAVVLVGAVLLIIPGVVTDVVGLFCVVPFTRRIILRQAKAVMNKKGLKKDEIKAEYEVLD